MIELKYITFVIGSFSALFAVYVFYQNSVRERKAKTLDYWEKINAELKTKLKFSIVNLDDLQGHNQEEIMELLNIFERLAVGINIRAYDIKVLHKIAGPKLLDAHENLDPFVKIKRQKTGRERAWSEFDLLIKKIRKIENTANKKRNEMDGSIEPPIR